MRLRVGLIYTLAGDELLEGGFIDPFVGVDSTFEALEITGGLSILVFILCRGGPVLWWLSWLKVQPGLVASSRHLQ